MWIKKDSTYFESNFKEIGVTAGFTTRIMGDMKNVLNRAFLKNLVIGNQTHSDGIYNAKNSDAGSCIPNNDGFVSDDIGLTLGVFTADCIAVYLVSKDGRMIAIVHAGWRGLMKGVLKKILMHYFNTNEMLAAIGPHIKNCCYQVKDDVGKLFPNYYRDGRLDLAAVAVNQLTVTGVNYGNISVSDICTCCNNDFFSYRRDHSQERHLAFIRKNY